VPQTPAHPARALALAPDHLRCTSHVRGTTLQVDVEGEWCLGTTSRIEAALTRAVDAAPPSERVVADLTGVEFADSSAVAALVRLARRARAKGVHLVAVVAPGPVARLAGLTGLHEHLDLAAVGA
jgi:anti-anti-sigma factor